MPIVVAEQVERVVLEAIFQDTRRFAPDALRQNLEHAAAHRRAELETALQEIDGLLAACAKRRDAAMDAMLDTNLSTIMRDAFTRRAEEAMQHFTDLEDKKRVLRLGIDVLDDHSVRVERVLRDPQLDPLRWREPLVCLALQRALHLLVHKAHLIEIERGLYQVELWLYRDEELLGREITVHESACATDRTKTLWARRAV